MNDIPNAEQQTPSIEDIFARFQGMPAEQQTPALAAILQAVVGQMAENDARLQEYCAKLDDLDKEIHEDFFGPIHDQYTKGIRSKGVEGLKGKYGARFDEIAEPLKAFGVDDIYGKLYDYLEELKKGPDWKDEMEGPTVDGIHSQAMERISAVRGKPAEEKAAEAEKPAEIEKKPAGSIKEKLAAGKRRSMIDGY
jgi:hypothetical protein